MRPPRYLLHLSVLAAMSATPLCAQELLIRNGFTRANGVNNSYAAGAGYMYAADAGALSIYASATGALQSRTYLPGQICDLELVGTTLYVAARHFGLRILDVSTATAPVETGSFVPEDGDVRDVAVSGGFAYLLVQTQSSGTEIRTLNLANMAQTSTFAAPASNHDIYVLGDLEATATSVIYTAVDTSPTFPAATPTLGILDTRTTPGAPTYVGRIAQAETATALHASPGSALAYMAVSVTNLQYGLRVFDLTNPTSPVLNGNAFLTTAGAQPVAPRAVIADGSVVFVAVGAKQIQSAGALTTFRITGGVPSVGNELPLLYRAASLGVDGNRVMVGGGDNSNSPEAELFDVTNPNAPVSLGTQDVPNFNEGVYVVDDYAYLASGNDGLLIVDVSNPDRPQAIGSADLNNSNLAENIWVRDDGDYAWGAEGNVTVCYDTSTKSSPTIAHHDDYGGWQEGVRERDDFLYVFSHDMAGLSAGGVTLVDVSTPGSPTVLSRYDIKDTVTDPSNPKGRPKDGYVDANGYVYVAATTHFWILQHNTPGNTLTRLTDVDVTSLPGCAGMELIDLDKRGDYVYAAAKGSATTGLVIFDVSNPASPVHAGTLATQQGIQGVWIDGSHAYISNVVSTGQNGVTMLDLTNPTTPTVVDELVMSDTILNTHVSNGRLYCAGFRAGTPIADIQLTPPNLFDDDFSYDLHEWTASSGLWAITDGRLAGYDGLGSTPTLIADSATGAARVMVTAKAKSGSTLGFAAVLFDYQSPGNTKFAALNAAANEWSIGELVGGTATVHQVLSDTINFDVDYDLDVQITGNTATLRVGGVTKVSHAFASINGGSAGLGVLLSWCEFEDFVAQ